MILNILTNGFAHVLWGINGEWHTMSFGERHWALLLFFCCKKTPHGTFKVFNILINLNTYNDTCHSCSDNLLLNKYNVMKCVTLIEVCHVALFFVCCGIHYMYNTCSTRACFPLLRWRFFTMFLQATRSINRMWPLWKHVWWHHREQPIDQPQG